ncbi:hypothetical protein P9112_009478 [Eukaryota sp. TZLM1-RC]
MHLPHVDVLGRPHEIDVPEVVEDVIEVPDGNVCLFNPSGAYLVIGLFNGLIHIVDYYTRSIASTLDAHDSCITAINWSSCSKYLLAGSQDGRVTLWDASSGSLLSCLSLSETITNVSFHPHVPSNVLISSHTSPPRMLSFSPSFELTSSSFIFASQKSGPCLALFSSCGSNVFVARRITSSPKSSSYLSVLSWPSMTTLVTTPIATTVNTMINSISGKLVLLNCDDHKARVFKLSDSNQSTNQLVSVAELSDAVSSSHWKCFAFSPNEEYIIAATIGGTSRLFVWNILFNQFIKTMDTPKEGVASLSWHPTKPITVALGGNGLVFYGPVDEVRSDKWKRFLPNFEPLEDNEYFSEPEDQFDEEWVSNQMIEGHKSDIELTEQILLPPSLVNSHINPQCLSFCVPCREFKEELVLNKIVEVDRSEDDVDAVFEKARSVMG